MHVKTGWLRLILLSINLPPFRIINLFFSFFYNTETINQSTLLKILILFHKTRCCAPIVQTKKMIFCFDCMQMLVSQLQVKSTSQV